MLILVLLGVIVGLALHRRSRALVFALVFATFALGSSVVSAAAGDEVVTESSTLTIAAMGVTLLVSVFLPVLTGIITKVSTSGFVKGLITLVSNGITALISQATLADGTALLSWQTFVIWLVGFVGSIGTYTGLWQPAGITSSRVLEVNLDTGQTVAVPGKLANVGVT